MHHALSLLVGSMHHPNLIPAPLSRATPRALAAVAMVAVALLCPAASAQGPTPEQPADSAALRLRNIYVPEGEVSKWPTEGKTYLPIETEQLQQLLELASRSAPETPRVTTTVLHATTDPAGVLQGNGHLRIVSPGDGDAWLSFPESNGRIAQAWWDSPAGTAQLGYRGTGGGLSLRVPRSGQLEIEWELAPHTAQGDYQLRLPPSLATVLVLDLAEGEVPLVAPDAGVLVIGPTDPAQDDQSNWWSSEIPPRVAGRTRWVLTSRTGAPLAWQMRRPGGGGSGRQNLVEYSAAADYKVAENGTRLSYRLRLAGEGLSPGGLVLDAPRELVVTDVAWGSQPVVWSRTGSDGSYLLSLDTAAPLDEAPIATDDLEETAPAEDPRTATFEPEPRELTIEAWCPTPLGEAWQVPQLALRDGSWLHEKLTLQIDPSLELCDLTPSHLRLARGSAGSAPEPLTFQKLRAAGRVRLELARRQSHPCVRIGRFIELDPIAATAAVRSVLECERPGDEYHLQAEVLEGWTIQSVVARSGHRVEDWYLSRDPDGRSILTLRATIDAATIDRDDPLELDIEAHRSASPNEGWQRVADHLVLRWSQVDVVADYITFDATGPYQVDFLATPPAVAETLLDPIVGPLLPSDVTGDVFDVQAMDNAARVNLVQPSVEYDAQVTLDVWDESPRWRRECRVQIEPRQGLVDEMELVLPGHAGQTLRWRLASQNEWRELPPVGPANVEVNRARRTVSLSQPMAGDFQLVIDLGEASSQQLTVEPVQLPGARRQTTRIVIHSPQPTGLVVAPREFVMEPLPQPRERGAVHSAWRLALRETRSQQESPQLQLRREASAAIPPRAQVGQGVLYSQYDRSGSSHHRYDFVVANQGESQMECTVPESAQNVRWWRPDTSDQGRVYPKENQFVLPLPLDQESPAFRVEFTLPGEGIASTAVVSAPWPSLSLPALAGEWVVEIPANYLLTGAPLPVPQPGWKGRLLGVFAPAGPPDSHGERSLAQRTYRMESPAQGPIELKVLDHQRRVAVALFLGVVALMASRLLLRRWFAAGVLVAGLLTAAALVLPWGAAIYASALNAGMWLGIALYLIRTLAPRPSSPRIVGEPPSESVSLIQVTAGVVLALVLWPTTTWAAPPGDASGDAPQGAVQATEPTARASVPDTEAVLIPVDEQGRADSDRRFVTPRLLRELLARRDAQQAADGWMLTAANYQGELLPSTGSSRLQSGTWTLAYEVQVFHTEATIHLPLVRSQATWETSVSVDGIATPLQWDREGKGCRFTIAEPGQYLVKLQCTPLVNLEDQNAGIALQLPPLPGAVLRLKVPSSRGEVRVDGRPLSGNGGMGTPYQVGLAMRPLLKIDWPYQASPTSAGETQASERSWMEVSHQGIEVECRLQLRGNNSVPDQLLLRSSLPAHRLLGEETASTVVAPDWQRSWRVNVEPSSTLPEGRMVRVRLLLERSEVWGRVRFPEFQLEGVTIADRQYAATAAEGIVLALDTETPGSSILDPEMFLTDWPGETLPDIAVQKSPQGPWPVLAVAPRRDDLSPDETLHVGGFADRLEVVYEGDFPRSQNRRLLQTLRISPDLQIERVEIVRTNQPQATRYTRPQPDRLVVWFDTPLERSFRLEVVGRVEAQSPGVAEVPQISAWAHPPASQRLLVYSARDLAVELVDDQRATSSEPSSSVPSRWDAYAVGSYQVATLGTAPLGLRLAPNRVRYEAHMLTAMLPTQAGWVAEVMVAADVTEGRLSQLELELPPALAESIALDAPPSASLDRTHPGRVRVVLGRIALAGEQVQARLRVPIRPTTTGEVHVPEVRLRGAAQLDRYVSMVPGAIQSGAWVHRGVTAVEPPEVLHSLVDTWPEALVYRVTHSSPVAVRWIPRRPPRELQGLGLIETRVEYTVESGCVLRSRVVLPPSASDHAMVHLPADQELLAIGVDGAPGVVEQAGEQRYLVRLPEGELPRAVEVVARWSKRIPHHGEVDLHAIEVAMDDRTLQPERVLWRVVDRSSATQAQSESAERFSSLDSAAIRLTHLLDTSSGSSAALASSPPDTQTAWAGYWHSLLRTAQAELAAAIDAHRETNLGMVDVADQASEFDELLLRADQRMELLEEVLPVGGVGGDSRPLWPAAEGIEASAARFVMAGDAGPLVLRLAPVGEGDVQGRWGGALVALALTAAVALVANRVGGLVVRDPLFFAVVLVLGVTWWLWAPVRWAGFVVALAAALAWLRWSRRFSN